MKEVNINFHGVNVRISCDREQLLTGAELILNRYITENSKPELFVNITEADNFWGKEGNPESAEDLISGMEQIGRRIFIKGNDEVFVKQFVDYEGLSCWYRANIINLIYDDKTFAGQRDLYRTCYMLTTIFPIATYLAKKRDMFFLHGGAVKFKGKNIAFLGLQGVGKSTLMLRMLREAGGGFLSDNIYFYDSSKIFACPETLRLDDKSIEFISPPRDLLRDTGLGTDLGRRMYIVNDERCMDSCRPDVFLIPRFSPIRSEIRLADEDILTLIAGFNELALELRAFDQWSAPFLMMDGSFLSRGIEALQTLLKNTPVYHLLIKKGDPPDRLIELIKRLVVA